MEDLAGFAVIALVLAIVFGSMAACGVLGAAVASRVPAVRRGPSRVWHRWVSLAVLAGTAGGSMLAIVAFAGASVVVDGSIGAALPIVCWSAAFVAGAGSRVIDARVGS